MKTEYKSKPTFARFLKDTAGSMALVWGVIGVGVVMTVGAAYDVSQVSKAKAIAQMAADNMALTASIAVDKDNDDRYAEGQAYSYRNLGGPKEDFTDSMHGTVEYDVDDDGDGESNLLARATVSGTYSPAFVSALGVQEIPFSAVSDVAYAQREGTPASIFFAVDNSGSMGWLDAGGANKLSALKDSMRNFMTTLQTINNDQNNVFRTALWPYSQDYDRRRPYISDDGIITNKDVPPGWGGLTNGEITRMHTQYGTDSSGSLEAAAAAFALEDAVHLSENGEDDPIKFMIFMSDGANNPKQERVCGPATEYWLDTWRGLNRVYFREYRWFDRWVIHHPEEDGPYPQYTRCSWQTTYSSDERSLEACTQMKSAGVTVYTIGYHLVAGWNSGYYTYQSEVDRAQALLASCASDADHYILASDANDLNTALTAIGQEVMIEVIRVKR